MSIVTSCRGAIYLSALFYDYTLTVPSDGRTSTPRTTNNTRRTLKHTRPSRARMLSLNLSLMTKTLKKHSSFQKRKTKKKKRRRKSYPRQWLNLPTLHPMTRRPSQSENQPHQSSRRARPQPSARAPKRTARQPSPLLLPTAPAHQASSTRRSRSLSPKKHLPALSVRRPSLSRRQAQRNQRRRS